LTQFLWENDGDLLDADWSAGLLDGLSPDGGHPDSFLTYGHKIVFQFDSRVKQSFQFLSDLFR
jgi:hypothetical protein